MVIATRASDNTFVYFHGFRSILITSPLCGLFEGNKREIIKHNMLALKQS
jgi:hypothetical protein